MTSQLVSAKQWFNQQDLVTFIVKVVLGANIIALLAQVSVDPAELLKQLSMQEYLPQLSIYIGPVPITGQTLGVTIVGFALGRNAGISAILLYLFEGIVGLPVFADFAFGYQVLVGKTGGYLIGFVFAAGILGHFSDKGVLKNFWKSFAVAILATVVIFACGLAQLAQFFPPNKVLEYGLIPFIPGGIIKALLASVLVIPAYRFFSKI